MSKDLLLEIGVEEIPAGELLNGSAQLKAAAEKEFTENRITFKKIEAFATPRRLAIILHGVSDKQKEMTLEVMGPPKRIAFDDKGNPTGAAAGFAKTNGLDVKDLKFKETPKGEYLFVIKKDKGGKTADVLPVLLKKLVSGINWPKSMRWHGDFRFIRPVRWITAVFGKDTVEFEVADVRSGNKTYGHRLSKKGTALINEPAKYEGIMHALGVIPDFESRKKTVLADAEKAAKKAGGKLLNNDKLTEEITNLAEDPSAILGSFDKKYLSLPKDLLVEVMEKSQKYFPVIDAEGKLLPNFVMIRNGKGKHDDIIRDGNERVLVARFEDAAFFFANDRKTKLIDKAGKLASVIFQVELGSLQSKVERLKILFSKNLDVFKDASEQKVMRAIELCKIDLTTDMVKEFTGLQGVMGREYALLDGEDRETAAAISEHYLPRFAGDKLPAAKTGAILSIIDKIDTVVGCFGAGLNPTGSQDPYGLRRSILGVINIAVSDNYDLSINKIAKDSYDTYAGKLKVEKEKVAGFISDFIRGRLEAILAEKGIRHDVADAVLSADSSNPSKILLKAAFLNTVAAEEAFGKNITAFSRVTNIIPKGFKTGQATVNEEYLKHEAEKNLYAFTLIRRPKFNEAIKKGDYRGAYDILCTLVEGIDKFFEAVLVMDKNEQVKNNRLTLLYVINEMFLEIADFRKIVTK